MLRGVHHTAESNCTPRSQNLNLHLFQVAFKETYIIKEQICSIKCGLTKPNAWLRRVMHTKESKFSNLMIEYLSEIETEFKICFKDFFIRGLDGFESWKKLGRKSRDTLPLSRSGWALLSMFAQLNFDSDGSGSATWYSTLKNYWFVQLYILFAHPHCIL